MTTTDTIRALESERNLLSDSIKVINNTISVLQGLIKKQEKRRGRPPARQLVADLISPPVRMAHASKQDHKRKYTKRSAFWGKPHPRKKK